MKAIEIAVLENGAHRNQTFHGTLPDGWAVVPDALDCVNFPFGDVEAEEIDGVMTVTKWTPREIPVREETDEIVITDMDRLEAQVFYTAMMTDTLMEG